MEYRIIIETEMSGKKWFYVQRKWLGILWVYLGEVRDISMAIYTIVFDELKKAEEHIQSLIDAEYARRQSKIIKREVVPVKISLKLKK